MNSVGEAQRASASPRISLAARPKVEPDIICPIGNIAPQHLGQFFFDQLNGVFYRARGLTEMDWHLVTPAELTGSFIKSFVDFLEPRHHAEKLTEEQIAAERKAADDRSKRPEKTPWIVDEVKAGEGGFRVSDARVWSTPAGAKVMQARIRVEIATTASLFAGFCFGPVSPVLPIAHGLAAGEVRINDPLAVGFVFDDGFDADEPGLFAVAHGQIIGSSGASLRDRHTSLRVELGPNGRIALYATDGLIAESVVLGLRPEIVNPRVSLFDYGMVRP